MFRVIKTAAIAGLVSFTALAVVPAKADNLNLSFGGRDARIGIYSGNGSRMHYPRYHEQHWWSERRCTPERALYKAQRIGVHRARIDYVGQHEIGVVGRSRGERVYLTFARAHNCPIIG